MLNKYIYIRINNPFKTIFKIIKYFKCPKLNITLFKPYKGTFGKYLSIISFDIDWHDKYTQPYYLKFPYIRIVLFNKIGVQLSLLHQEEYCYYESILYFVYYKKSLQYIISNIQKWKTYKGTAVDPSLIIKSKYLKDKNLYNIYYK